MTTLADITALVDDKVRSTSLGATYDTGARDRAIAQALVAYGDDAPRTVADMRTGLAGGATLPLPSGWDAARCNLQAVEYPIGQAPMATVAARVDLAAAQLVLADSLPADAAAVVWYSAPHAADGSTVPVQHVNLVACWAAAEICRQAATAKAHERDATIGAQVAGAPTESGELSRRAKEWMAVYRVGLGLPDTVLSGAAGGSGSGGSTVQAAGTVVSWGARRDRAPFYSRGVWNQ